MRGAILMAVLVAVLTVGPAQAVEKKASSPAPSSGSGLHQPSIVAIVDVQRVLQDSKASSSARRQIDTQRSKFQAEIAAEETDLREAEKKLIKLREESKTEAYVEQEQKLQQRFLTVERHVQARRKALDQAFSDSMNTVRTALIETVGKIAQEKGVTLVIVKQQVIWNSSAIDITDEVMARLDKALPQIQIRIMTDEEVEQREESAPLTKRPAQDHGKQ